MTQKRKAEMFDKLIDMLAEYEINGVGIFDEDEELERFLLLDLGLTPKELEQLGFEFYV
jgi:hypothetical protein